jgi:thiosulfate dehydrogenase [quinone] large subunit
LGVVIFLHGVVRLAGHYQQFVGGTIQSFAKTPLSAGAVHFAALCIPSAEAVLGFFILTGLLTRLALIGGALLMIFLLFGKSMQQDWTTVAIQLVYAFLYFVLLAYRGWNRLALDSVFRHNTK